jgi:hypothetical protein
MVAPVPAQISKLASRPPAAHLPLRTPPFTMRPPLTPLLLITYIQPPYFQAITHSFAQRQSTIPPNINSFRTLPVATGVHPVQLQILSVLSVPQWQIHFFHSLGASLPSLCDLFCTRFSCFQSFAASFPKTPGVGVPLRGAEFPFLSVLLRFVANPNADRGRIASPI